MSASVTITSASTTLFRCSVSNTDNNKEEDSNNTASNNNNNDKPVGEMSNPYSIALKLMQDSQQRTDEFLNDAVAKIKQQEQQQQQQNQGTRRTRNTNTGQDDDDESDEGDD